MWICCHPKLLELLFHLAQVHVIVDLGQLVQEHGHALVVCDVCGHQVLQFLGGLLLRMHLCELLQRLQEVLLELCDGRADKCRRAAWCCHRLLRVATAGLPMCHLAGRIVRVHRVLHRVVHDVALRLVVKLVHVWLLRVRLVVGVGVSEQALIIAHILIQLMLRLFLGLLVSVVQAACMLVQIHLLFRCHWVRSLFGHGGAGCVSWMEQHLVCKRLS